MLKAFVKGVLGAGLGNPWVMIGLAGFLVAACAGALLWHAGKVRSFGAERFAAGETAERGKWLAETARLRVAAERRRRDDEDRIRALSIAHQDLRVQLREERDDFDRQMLEMEAADRDAGASPPVFDPRVLRLLR